MPGPSEEKGTAIESFRGVIGFGPHVTMLLNGDAATQLQTLEDKIAASYKLKGEQKQIELAAIRDSLSRLHLEGCRDPRLRMLADAIKYKLPRRKRKPT